MKTIKIIITALATFSVVSCNTYYRMVTTLDRKGNVLREVYANGDSSFMAGDISHNPFLFDIKSGWDIKRLDSAKKYNFFGDEKSLNVKVSKSVSSIDLISKELIYPENHKSLVVPEESLTKKFRWFYTNYTYTGVYKKLNYNVPVPIDKYLSHQEQLLWSQGDQGSYKALNGSEINEILGEIEGRFMDWYSRNCFEICLNEIMPLSKEETIEKYKDNIYKQLQVKKQWPDIYPETVCQALDAFYKTNRYSGIYKENKKVLDSEFEKATLITEMFNNIISYELVVPGKLLSANTSVNGSDTLVWKVDGMRILFSDYTLTAQYRVANLWAFILSGLILITAILSTAVLLRKKISG